MKSKNWPGWAAAGGSPPESKSTPWLRRSIALVLPLVLLGLLGATTTSLSASPDKIITVCQAGPPQCDSKTIQAALDAAAPGDTVQVEPGIYNEQLTLRSQVALESTGGPEVTIIRATQGPIVRGSAVVSVTLRGLSIGGQGVTTQPVGIDLADSQVSLVDCIVSGLRGKDGVAGALDGESAIAIRSGGASKLVMTGVTVQDIRGGNGLAGVEGGAAGGDAIGVAVTGDAQVTMTATSIRRLTGGSAGSYAWWPYGCSGRGGAATAIQANGDMDLTVSDCQITDLMAGEPCSALAAYCEGGAGATVGIQATGGRLVVRDSLFSGFLAQPAHGSEANYAIHTAFTRRTRLERNTITALSASGYPAGASQVTAPESPFCVPGPGSVIGIASESDSSLVAVDNSLNNLLGTGPRGDAVGILVNGVADVELSRNKAIGISGGYGGLTANGFRLEQVNSGRVDANVLGGIYGGFAPGGFGYGTYGSVGGSATGIELSDVTTATITNNVIRALRGGWGTDIENAGAGYDGGDAAALLVTGSSARIWNNSCYQTVAGRGGEGSPPGQPGSAVGLKLAGAGQVSVANNAFVQHGIGLLSTLPAPPYLEHNDLSGNRTDYEGTTPGANDLHVAPGFVSPESGDLHLRADSALIDAGTNGGIPPKDLDGEARPLDGNGDGSVVADIGADEYWAGLQGSKTVDKLTATAGDILTYRVTVAVPTGTSAAPGVRITDTIPSHVTYVQGSLSASSGAWTDAGGMITWTGTVSDAAPVALTFKVRVDEVVGPLAIVNRAVLDDRVGITRTLQAMTLVDPLPYYFPFVSKSH